MNSNLSDSIPILCPGIINCSTHKNLVSFDLGRIPSYVVLGSSTLSCLGSALILFAYFYLKDIRTGAQKVITLLAVADLFTASGYIIGSVNFLTHFNQTGHCDVFTNICEIQSFITTWSSMSSFSWTCILAFYFFMVIIFNNASLASRLMPMYNIISWLGPLLIVFPLLLTRNLGYTPYVTSNWCFIKDTQFNRERLLHKPKVILLTLVGGKFWEVVSYLVVIVLYLCIKIYISKSKKAITADSSGRPQLAKVEKRLLAIPLLYILLRVWGTLQFIFSLAVDHTNTYGCIPETVQKAYFVFGILQAIGDGGQGWANAILYIFLSPSIRRRLFGEPFDKCLVATEEKLQALLETETETLSRSNVQSQNAGQSPVHVTGNGNGNGNENGQPATGYRVKSYQMDTPSDITTITSTAPLSTPIRT